MRAILLAAGRGQRLGDAWPTKPKALIPFAGRSLLARHLALLDVAGVGRVCIATGFEAGLVEAEAQRTCPPSIEIEFVHNPDYRQGSLVTLHAARAALCRNEPVLVMDADVLYDRRMLERLLASPHANCYLLDRDFEPGEEPMKLAVKDGRLADFARTIDIACDYCGESVGFFRFGPAVAHRLAEACAAFMAEGRGSENHEAVLRVLLGEMPAGTFGFEDVTGLPWIEIDFAADIRRAETDILPRLLESDR